MTYNSSQQRQQLRQQLRAKRRNLPESIKLAASQRLIQQAANFQPLQTVNSIALFISMDEELNTRPLIEWLWQNGKQVYLPRIHPFAEGELIFQRYTAQTPLIRHKFGIWEPIADVTQITPRSALEMIFVPLVGFDARGERLGMGGGYYDRTLQGWTETSLLPVGIAYDCQFVAEIPREAWDIPLAAVLTPTQTWCWLTRAEKA